VGRAQTQGVQVGQPQVVVLGDVAQRVGAFVGVAVAIAEGRGIGSTSNAETVENADYGAGHREASGGSMRSATRGCAGDLSPIA
jgi:hypothetical protein